MMIHNDVLALFLENKLLLFIACLLIMFSLCVGILVACAILKAIFKIIFFINNKWKY